MLLLSGFSEERSAYCKISSYLRLYGWILSPHANKVRIFSNNTFLLEIPITLRREEIWTAYNKIGTPFCGWAYEGTIKDIDPLSLFAHFYNDDTLIFQQKLHIQFDNEKEEYLTQFSILNYEKISSNVTNIYHQLLDAMGDSVTLLNFQEEAYLKWFHQVNYCKNYPKYCQEFSGNKILHTKALQHYIAIQLLDIKKDDIYMDIASSNSVCPDIIKHYYSKNIYRQDIRYEQGLHKNRIGSNAEDIPMPDDSINKMALHCSFEHFENNSDINFIQEAYRLLKMNGKLVITPLYLSETAHILTSPSIWENKYGLNGFPKFTKDYPIVIKEEISQRQEKVFSVDSLIREIIKPFEALFEFQIFHIDNIYNEALAFYPKFTLVATKKA